MWNNFCKHQQWEEIEPGTGKRRCLECGLTWRIVPAVEKRNRKQTSKKEQTR
jgi:hypothetical protein